MRQHLENLAAHLEGLDSESGDAKAIRWALAEIDRLEGEASVYQTNCQHNCTD